MSAVEERTIELLRRAPALGALRDGPVDRRTFAERLNISRSTAYRATTTLVERGAAESVNGEYRTTPYGDAVERAARRFRAAVRGAERMRPVLDAIDHPSFIDHVHLFEDADVVRADPDDPYRVADRAVAALEDATELCCTVTGNAFPDTVDRLAGLSGGPARVDAVVDAATVTRIETLADRPLEDVVDATHLSVTVGEVPFTACVADGERVLVVGCEAPLGLPTVLAITDDPDAVEWSMRLFRRARATAEPVGRSGEDEPPLQAVTH